MESSPFKLQTFIHTVAESGRILEFENQKQAIESIGTHKFVRYYLRSYLHLHGIKSYQV